MTRRPDTDAAEHTETPMILVRDVSKSYGHTLAVSNLSFEVGANEVVGFLGPNGAGKSTTIRIIAGFLGASSGHVIVNGHRVASESLEAREHIGYMAESVPLYPELRVGEYLRYRAELKRVARRQRGSEVQRVMRLVQLDDHEQVLIGSLSKGYRQRVGLADALLGSPAILVLDEPTAGMDPNQIREVRALIRSLSGEHTILLSTHIMSEVEATCDRAVIIDKGRLVAQGTIDQLRKLRQASEAQLVVRGERELLERVLGASAWCERWTLREATDQASNPVLHVQIGWSSTDSADACMEQAVTALIEAGLRIQQANNVTPSLEEVFATLTEPSATSEPSPDDPSKGEAL